MSKVAIQGAATGTGVFTLASPATNTNRTLVLPDEAGTVLTDRVIGVNASAPDNSVVVDASGNVGIGTSSPTNLLTVSKNQNATTRILISNTDTTNGSSRGNLQVTGGTVETVVTSVAGDAGYIGTGSNHPLEFITNGSGRMRIDSAGRVTMPYQPAFCVTSPNNGNINAIQKFQNTILNRGNHYSSTTGIFTAPVAGAYQFNWHILSATAEGYHYGYLAKNGNTVVYAQVYTASGIPNGETAGGSAIVELAQGDSVGYYHTGGSYTDAHASIYSVFSGHLIG
jgi:hypothetical protein